MDDTIIASRRAAAIMKSVSSKLSDTIAELGWECYDDVSVDIGGTSVYMIDGAGTKWAPVKGTRKYNKDAFIVIKNNSRNPIVPSVNDDPERLAHIPRWKQASNKAIAENLLTSIAGWLMEDGIEPKPLTPEKQNSTIHH